jgi:homoserine dehydrogenase
MWRSTLKDADGIYEADPACAREVQPRRFVSVTYADAHRVAGPLIQSKAIAFLEQNRASAEVAALGLPYASKVHAGPTEFSDTRVALPSDVVLLGLGTVGFGVYQRLLANSTHFRTVGVLVRDAAKYSPAHVPQALLHTDSNRLRELQPDLVIDALPGLEPSCELVQHFLNAGVEVITANKALIAEHGTALDALAARAGTRLRYSAAVGGACPMIEATDRVWSQGRITSLAAVLNGTCNFVVDRCGEGASLEEAIAEAKAHGFAEADPSDDLTGRDAQRKLRILCRHAFDEEPDFIEAELLDEAVAVRARAAAEKGQRVRQIARAFLRNAWLIASINFEVVARESPFGQLEREWNGLEIKRRTSVFVKGRGAGRWPTAEAVTADLFDAHRERVQSIAAIPLSRTRLQRANGRVSGSSQ